MSPSGGRRPFGEQIKYLLRVGGAAHLENRVKSIVYDLELGRGPQGVYNSKSHPRGLRIEPHGSPSGGRRPLGEDRGFRGRTHSK